MINVSQQANEQIKYIMITASLMALPAMTCYLKYYGNRA